MRTLLVVCALTAAGLLSARADDAAAQKDLKALQGTWKVVAAEQDGDPLDRIVGGTMTVKDNNFAIKTAGGTELKGDLILDPAKSPRHVNLAHQDGPLKDKTWQGIYELKGDALKICYAEADSEKERPTEFKTLKGSRLLFVELKREKK
jgi:uncharacterized protein (TIGR03067 family)